MIKELGRGGFGKVMLGQHKISKNWKAIKVVDASKFPLSFQFF
jgi:serine/threonine protein kinase